MSGMELSADEVMGAIRVTSGDARAAMAFLARHDATDCAEALGLVGYRGKAHRVGATETTRAVWRPGVIA